MTSTQAHPGAHTITLDLSDELYTAAQEAVTLGLASSPTDFILGAIRQRAREVRHDRMRRLAAEAMADPGFLADMQETLAAFQHVDNEDWTDESRP